MHRQGYSNRAAARKCRKERHSAAFLMEDGTVFQAYYFTAADVALHGGGQGRQNLATQVRTVAVERVGDLDAAR